jgi:hypothetical protein
MLRVARPALLFTALATCLGCGNGNPSSTGDGGGASLAGSPDASGGAAAGAECWNFGDAGGGECSFVWSSQTTTCSGGTTQGSCPAGIVGCCVLTAGSGGLTTKVGICYYDAATAAEFMMLCRSPGESWSTSEP